MTDSMYYAWLMNLIPKLRRRYSRLLRAMYDTPFRTVIARDESRRIDGLGLRHRYTWEQRLPPEASDQLTRECSVLEVMIALALRCQEDYLANPGDDDSDEAVNEWVMSMISSLGLAWDEDESYDHDYTQQTLDRFLRRDYSPDGWGSFFYIPGTEDMPSLELWNQMIRWIRYYKGGKIQ